MLKLLAIIIVILADNVYTREVTGKQLRQPGEISQKKCREYASFIHEDNECGHKRVKRIVGGELAGRTEFPHMAIIGFQSKTGNIRWQCGGSAISKQYILTAAHCLSSPARDPKFVLLGVTNLNDTNHRQKIKVAEKIVHPEYNQRSHYRDIGLVKLEKSIEINSYTRPACLYRNSQVNVAEAIATGWGITDSKGKQTTDLLKVTLNIVDHAFCNKKFETFNLFDAVRDDIHICTGKGTEAKDTCRGDAGGPLQIYHDGDDIACMYDIIGVTSFGLADCGGGPSVSTRVSNYIGWIEKIVWPEEF